MPTVRALGATGTTATSGELKRMGDVPSFVLPPLRIVIGRAVATEAGSRTVDFSCCSRIVAPAG
jgi:hypothetical protein